MPPTAVGMDLSVVLPVFKNRSQLPELYGRLTGVLSLAMPQYELVFVDDAGGDGSLEWLRGRVGSDPRVRLVEMGVNRGQHVAVVEGMAAATGSVVVVMDADLQDAPEEIPRLLDALRDEDAVIFARQRTRCQPRGRHTTGFLFKRVLRFVSGSRLPHRTGMFFATSHRVATMAVGLRNGVPYVPLLLDQTGYPLGSVQITKALRTDETSAYTATRRLALGFRSLRLALEWRLGKRATAARPAHARRETHKWRST